MTCGSSDVFYVRVNDGRGGGFLAHAGLEQRVVKETHGLVRPVAGRVEVRHGRRGHVAYAAFGVGEVVAHLPGSHAVPSLHLATEAPGGVALVRRLALVIELLLVHFPVALLADAPGASSHGPGLQAAESPLAVRVLLARLTLTLAVHREAGAKFGSVHVDADGAAAALVAGQALSAEAGQLVLFR